MGVYLENEFDIALRSKMQLVGELSVYGVILKGKMRESSLTYCSFVHYET